MTVATLKVSVLKTLRRGVFSTFRGCSNVTYHTLSIVPTECTHYYKLRRHLNEYVENNSPSKISHFFLRRIQRDDTFFDLMTAAIYPPSPSPLLHTYIEILSKS